VVHSYGISNFRMFRVQRVCFPYTMYQGILTFVSNILISSTYRAATSENVPNLSTSNSRRDGQGDKQCASTCILLAIHKSTATETEVRCRVLLKVIDTICTALLMHLSHPKYFLRRDVLCFFMKSRRAKKTYYNI